MIRQVVRVALGDADAGARKVARQLYWVLHNSPTLQSHMRSLYSDLEAPTQKHIQNEAALDNAELNDLLHIQQDPACLLKYVHAAVAAAAPEPPAEAAAVGAANVAPPAFEQVRATSLRPADGAPDPPTTRTTTATIPPPAPAIPAQDIGAPSGWEGLDDFDDAPFGAVALAKAPSAAGLSATAVKPSRRMSLGAGPVRVTQQSAPQIPSASDVQGSENTSAKSFAFPM
jgi:hypothetical protein